MEQERHELCVIGAGTAGFTATEAARAAGRDVVLVTGTEELGGTCILRGCMPAKAVLAATQAQGEVEKARGVGIETAPIHVDLPAIIRRKRALVDYFADDRLHELAEYPLVRGDARFVAPDTIVAGERRISAERFVIATGAAVIPPPIEGLETVRTMTSTGVLAMNRRRRVAALDLAAGGIEGDSARGIVVDAALRSVSNPRVFAAGDVLARRSLVHTAAYGGRLAAANAFAGEPEEAQWERWEAHALYTQPQVAVAGLTERQCRERGIEGRVATLPAGEVGKALVSDEAEGFVKMIARADDGRVAGIALVLDDAIDLAGEAIALIERGATARDVAQMPHLHPTMSELLARVAEKLC